MIGQYESNCNNPVKYPWLIQTAGIETFNSFVSFILRLKLTLEIETVKQVPIIPFGEQFNFQQKKGKSKQSLFLHQQPAQVD